jgi:hypothetical protein
LVQEVVTGRLDELAEVRATLDSRYDDLESSRRSANQRYSLFELLREREKALQNKSA